MVVEPYTTATDTKLVWHLTATAADWDGNPTFTGQATGRRVFFDKGTFPKKRRAAYCSHNWRCGRASLLLLLTKVLVCRTAVTERRVAPAAGR